jgi:hypothetical protein
MRRAVGGLRWLWKCHLNELSFLSTTVMGFDVTHPSAFE